MRIDPSGILTPPDQQNPAQGSSFSQDIAKALYGNLPSTQSSDSQPMTQSSSSQVSSPQQNSSLAKNQTPQTPSVQISDPTGPKTTGDVDISSAYSGLNDFMQSRFENTQQPQDGSTEGSSGGDFNANQLSESGDPVSLQGFTVPAASKDVGRIMEAIGYFESGGSYKAIGPPTKKGDRALGKYQVMAANVPSWTKEALGRSFTPQEYYNSPQIQDAVAAYKMGQYLKKYGNVGDVASVWFSGRPMAGNTSRDVIGTSVPKYVKNVIALYNRAGQNRSNDGSGGPGPAMQQNNGISSKFPSLSGQLPAQGNLTTPFGGQTNNEQFHEGIDIANTQGTPVRTPVAGTVVSAVGGKKQGDWGFGNNVIVKDAYGNSHRFSHLRDEWVRVGDKVKPGDGVGGMGNSGNAYSPSGGDGSHVDYRVRDAYGKYINPAIFLGKNK